MTTTALEPKDMEWIEKGVLGIEWSDGHKGVYRVRYLRQHCPCAACTDEWTGELKLKPDDIPIFVAVQDVEPVGRYALKFTFSDGHDTGLFSYAFLLQALPVRCMCAGQTPRTERTPTFIRLAGAMCSLVIAAMFSSSRRSLICAGRALSSCA